MMNNNNAKTYNSYIVWETALKEIVQQIFIATNFRKKKTISNIIGIMVSTIKLISISLETTKFLFHSTTPMHR